MPNRNGQEYDRNSERRQSSRKRPEQLVYVELEQDNGGMMLNVSEGGFSFHVLAPVPRDGKIHFAFAIDARRQLEGYGELEWAEEHGKVGALRFTEVSQEFREEIRAWLSEPHTPVERGDKSAQGVATPPDTREQRRGNGMGEPGESLPYPARMGKSEIASETLPPKEPFAMNISHHDKETATLAEQVKLAVEEKNTAPHGTQKETHSPSLSAMNVAREETNFTRPFGTIFPDLLPKNPEKTEPPVDIVGPAALEHAEEPRVLVQPREQEQAERIQELESLVAALQIPPEKSSRAATVGIVIIVLALLLGAAVYNFQKDIGESLIRLGEKMSGESRQARTETREAPANVSGISPGAPPLADAPAEPPNASAAPVQAEPNPPVSNSNVTPPVNAEAEPGQSELAEAERILASKNASPDTARAVTLLWAAVQKENPAAVLKLAELYIRGDVIPKNCDQARVLLTAIAKKGDAGTKAKLQELYQTGCP